MFNLLKLISILFLFSTIFKVIFLFITLKYRYYDSRDEKAVFKESKFNPSARYSPAQSDGSYDRYGDRVTKLGLNV